MKILIVNSLYYPDEIGGAEIGLRYLSEELRRRGLSVVVACLTAGPTLERSTVNDVVVIRIPVANVYWPFGRRKAASALTRLMWHLVELVESPDGAPACDSARRREAGRG